MVYRGGTQSRSSAVRAIVTLLAVVMWSGAADVQRGEAESVVGQEHNGHNGHHGGHASAKITPRPPDERPSLQRGEIIDKGLRVEFEVEPAYGPEGQRLPLVEGELADVRLRVSDAQTGAPVSALQPAVWISRLGGLDADLGCQERISRHLQGLLSFQADIDLNKYFILVLNDDGTIAVVDPLLGVSGITQLYAMVHLGSPGSDWVRGNDDNRMFVSLPAAGKVAVVDLEDFKVTDRIEVGPNPVRIALQPDGKYLWVAHDATDASKSSVSVIDTGSLERVAIVPVGAGHHEIGFTQDSLLAFVTNSLAGNVSLIDTQRLTKDIDIETGAGPVAVGYSILSERVYVASSNDGTIVEIDPLRKVVTKTIKTSPGIVAMDLAPDGRWAFVANLEDDRVDIIDTSRSDVVRSMDVGKNPHQFAFTDTYAYVRHLATADVTLIPLNQIDGNDPPAVKTVALGTRAPGEAATAPLADAIVPTGEWTAVIAANPADKMVYYYMEGMIAPMGSYSTYGRLPRAVAIADRSVRETEKGTYAARIRVPKAGSYTMAMLIDSPVVDHCFGFEVAADPLQPKGLGKDSIKLAFLNTERRVAAGESMTVRIFLGRAPTDQPIVDLSDVSIIATRPPGRWQQRGRAVSRGDGVYEFDVEAAQAGAYFVTVSVPSLGLDYTELPFMTFRATAPSEHLAASER